MTLREEVAKAICIPFCCGRCASSLKKADAAIALIVERCAKVVLNAIKGELELKNPCPLESGDRLAHAYAEACLVTLIPELRALAKPQEGADD